MSRRSTTPAPDTALDAVRGRRRRSVGAALCTTCLVAAIALTASPAAAAPRTSHAPTGSGSGVERATSMLPADSPDGAALRAAADRSAAAVTPDLQSVAAGDLSGVDVSGYQHPGGAAINWAAVRASGVTFAFVKASEGGYYKNPYYAQDVAGARAAGLSVGAYQYGRPEYPAVAQADYFVAAERAASPNLPPVLDLEDNGSQLTGFHALTAPALQAWTAAFLARVHADLGIVPIIYTGPYFWKDDMGGSAAFTGYPLWVANYTSSAAPDATGAWSAWTFWQFSDGSYPAVAPVPGISGFVDRDRFAGGAVGLAEVAAGSAGPWLQSVGTQAWGRPLTSLDLSRFVRDLQGGASRAAVVASMFRNPIGLQTSVRADYGRILGRAADPGGLASWVSARAGGMSAFREWAGLTESLEFYQDAGGTTAGFISHLYAVDLGRAPAASEVTHWAAVLAQGGRAAVSVGVGFSAEATGAAVNRGYEQVLGRAADAAGLAAFDSSALRSATGYGDMLARLYASAEYLSHAGLNGP